MKKTLLAAAIILIGAASLHAAEPTPVDTTQTATSLPSLSNGLTQVSHGKYTISAPAGVLQRENANQLLAFLPDGSFGMSLIQENVRPKKKELLNLAKGMAEELHLDPARLQPLNQNGLTGWWISGRAEQEIITAIIATHETDLIKIVALEKENLAPVGPQLVPTLRRD